MYEDLADALEDIKAKGYDHLFEVKENYLACDELNRKFFANELRITGSFHFDCGTDPGDDSTLYLIETEQGIKGYLIAGFTTYTGKEKAEFLDKLLSKK